MRARRGHWVYLVRCADGSYYCGYARDLIERIKTHNEGKGSKILRGKLPVRLAFARRLASRGAALTYEAALKRRSHVEKTTMATLWRKKR